MPHGAMPAMTRSAPTLFATIFSMASKTVASASIVCTVEPLMASN